MPEHRVLHHKDDDLIYKNLPNSKMVELLADYHYTDNRGVLHIIPKGFQSDGASIPRIVWTLAGTPFAPDVIRAAIVHDWLYVTLYDKVLADRIFHDILDEDGVVVFKRRVYKTFVVLFGRTILGRLL